MTGCTLCRQSDQASFWLLYWKQVHYFSCRVQSALNFYQKFQPLLHNTDYIFQICPIKKCTHKQKKKGSQKKICHVACNRMLRTECTSIIYENRGRRGLYPQHFRRSQHGL